MQRAPGMSLIRKVPGSSLWRDKTTLTRLFLAWSCVLLVTYISYTYSPKYRRNRVELGQGQAPRELGQGRVMVGKRSVLRAPVIHNVGESEAVLSRHIAHRSFTSHEAQGSNWSSGKPDEATVDELNPSPQAKTSGSLLNISEGREPTSVSATGRKQQQEWGARSVYGNLMGALWRRLGLNGSRETRGKLSQAWPSPADLWDGDVTDTLLPPKQGGKTARQTQRIEPKHPAELRKKNRHWTIEYAGQFSPALFSPPKGEYPFQRFPKAIIIGVGKCGTRALIEFLKMSPYIVAANSELHFFDLDVNFEKGHDWYRSQMPLSYSNQITIEKTPMYFWSPRAVEEIYKLNRTIRLIVIVRDPVTRVISQAVRLQGTQSDIRNVYLSRDQGDPRVNNGSRTVDWGIYVKYLRMWLSRFSLSQIHIVESSDLKKHPVQELQKLEKFLGVPPTLTAGNVFLNRTSGLYCMVPFFPPQVTCLPPGKNKVHPQLPPRDQKLLYDFYQEHNERLFSLLHRRFPWQPAH
ncbi:heparan sulfate glucosamine 3-O-sulfotransferase 1 [Aplysia californica]|uniref:Heparan sulfate glucosamine 3-O-sulfotransferase 1 n=1 Tax=Aplysia californica TaxID=6500 RepID=A0ABM1A2W7_APLCA|nr:heparan sulfate glucosamine 3-O-sulfotransferase 1 [Aplysia californica]